MASEGSSWLMTGLRLVALFFICRWAYTIRLHAINEFGTVIHEFDPWFNFRATQYLADNGLEKFFKWFDYMSWYPLGRPVGTTIYPGMQMTSVLIWRGLNALGYDMSLNDVCCYVPAWFGVSATIIVGLLTRECTKSDNAGVAASAVMSIIPAHIMRSVGGGYDNESIAVTAMTLTFFLWVRSLRNDSSWVIGVATGIAYVYMVAAWGGYIFVVNMIALHAGALVALGRYSQKLHRAYSLFYIVGTAGAIQIPVVGWTPLRSLEQMAPLAVFLGLQLWEVCERIIARQGGHNELSTRDVFNVRAKVFGGAAALVAVAVAVGLDAGYFGPLSSRVRGLFVQHTRTGNPLVDSVAEHQPASANAYWSYLYYMCYMAPIGLVISFFDRTDARYFIILYGMVTYYFSAKMNRLVILLGPAASALGGVAISKAFEWCYTQLEGEDDSTTKAEQAAPAKGKDKKNRNEPKSFTVKKAVEPIVQAYEENAPARKFAAVVLLAMLLYLAMQFYFYCWATSAHFSHPHIMYKARMNDGSTVLVDDYREAYWFLRDQTPEDSRVMAWWDYGYQITGIGNRTTIADGNTWNHEHIATLGFMLTSPEKRAHKLIRHLADYVLVWSGGGGDDLAKAPHLARIANSVYDDVCPGDPKCRAYGFKDNQGTPTPMMARSLLYKLTQHNFKPDVSVNASLFEEVFTSKYHKVRIFKVLNVSQKSKDWLADPSNRVCDAPGSWYCSGQYPPALDPLMKKKKAFAQLEDFNAIKDPEARKKAAEYQSKYMNS